MAFSGEVNDPESGTEPFTETGKALNPNLRGRDIRDAFAGEEYSVLLVANKFQTGFDQPLLCGIYVDRRLAGIQAVQTLSRLNRAHPGKDATYVLDFVNSEGEILDAFRAYHTTAELAGVTDPNLVYDLRAKLDAAGFYDDFEVDRVVAVEMSRKSTQGDLIAALEPVADRLMKRYKAAREKLLAAKEHKDEKTAQEAQDELNALILFKRDMGAYQHVYTFLSQIFDYGSTAIEKRASRLAQGRAAPKKRGFGGCQLRLRPHLPGLPITQLPAGRTARGWLPAQWQPACSPSRIPPPPVSMRPCFYRGRRSSPEAVLSGCRHPPWCAPIDLQRPSSTKCSIALQVSISVTPGS